jgi:hypothetical protein
VALRVFCGFVFAGAVAFGLAQKPEAKSQKLNQRQKWFSSVSSVVQRFWWWFLWNYWFWWSGEVALPGFGEFLS